MKKLLNLLEFLAKTFRFLTLAIVSFSCFFYAIPIGNNLFMYLFNITLATTFWSVLVYILIMLLLMLPFIGLGLVWESIEVKLIEKYQNFKRKLLNE